MFKRLIKWLLSPWSTKEKSHKLAEDEIADIRFYYSLGYSVKTLEKVFKRSSTTIYKYTKDLRQKE